MINPLISRPLIVLCVFWVEIQPAHSQNITGPTGAEQWMLGGSSASVTNVFSANNNAGAITQTKRFRTGLYSEQRFTELHLQTANLCVIVPTKFLHLGASVNYFGYAVFNQQRITLSVAKKLSTIFSLGVQLNYVSTFIQDYGTTGNPALGVGVYAQPVSKLSLGFVLFNPTQSSYGKNITDRIPTYARLGCTYTVSAKIRLVAEVDQQLERSLTGRMGLYYQIHEVLGLACGVATQPAYFTLGTTLLVRKMKVDLAISKHEILGISPHLAIVLPFQQ